MQVVIVKYNAGNIQSVLFALERIAVQATVTDDPAQIKAADKVIFPGVGEASSAMRYLQEYKLDEVIRTLKQPVLGICLGMQLLCAHSEENDTNCLGVFPGVPVKRFAPENKELKVPQVGWNTITDLRGPLFAGIGESAYCYFVHGYYAPVNTCTIARADYGGSYSAAMQKDNFYAVQFHPEKSAGTGDIILNNFLAL
jgi:imidazole glycerol-phosphate synthase subunit HisH